MSVDDQSPSQPFRGIRFVARAMKKTVATDGTITIEAVDPSLVKPSPENAAGFASAKCLVTTDDLGDFVCQKNGCTLLCFGPYVDDDGNNYCSCR